MQKIAIIGGGIAGLSTAYYLQQEIQRCNAPVAWMLFEAEQRLGGKILTERQGGFTIDAGPDSFLTQKPWALELCHELGLSEDLIGTNEHGRRVFVWSAGRLHQMPDGVMLMVPTQIGPFLRSSLLSWRGKLRMGLELLVPPRPTDGDESLAHFVRRRLGEEALRKIAEPMIAGIYLADAETLSLASTFPRFLEMERTHGSLLRALRAQMQQGPRPRGEQSAFMSLREGMAEMVRALAKVLPSAAIHIGRPVRAIHRSVTAMPSYNVELADGTLVPADAIVLATPAYVTAGIIGQVNRRAAAILQGIEYVSSATVSLGFRRADISHPLNGFGFVVPRHEKRSIIACSWTSTKFPGRAPHDAILIRAFLGGAGAQSLLTLDDTGLVRLVQDELSVMMGLHAQPILSRVFRWPRGNPQYRVGHGESMATLEATLQASPGVFVTGSAYRGVGVPDCIHQGALAAQQVLAYTMHREGVERVGSPVNLT